MASDKNTLLALIANLYPDNTTQLITPAKLRQGLEEMISSDSNLLEATTQTHIGLHDFTGGLQRNGIDVFIANKARMINSLSELPAPVSGVITLAPNTTYIQGNDLDLGTDRIAMGINTVWSGFESLNITLTYTGTGDLFTMVNTSNRINNVFLSAVNGRLFNWSSASGEQLRVVDVQSNSDKYGIFNGNSSLLRLTNISPTIATNGLEFLGDWASVLYEVSGVAVNGGTFFNLGSATFDSILIDKVFMVLAGGTTFLSGLVDSGNVNTGGLATVLLTRISGAGTILNNITTDDALWEFFHNDEIRDTRPDALLSLQGNAVAETIVTQGVAVKVTGNNTWVDERSSQSTSDNTGKSTYDGGKPIVVPITLRASVEPVSGTNVTISVYVALNGTPIANSAATARVDNNDPRSITVIWQEEAQPGDFVEMYISNDSNTTDLLVSNAVIRIN